MENDPQQKEVTIIRDDVDVIATLLQEMESNVSSNSRCCIYKVPEYIAKGKEECYQPLATSIGPVFYKKDPKLEAMQELKRILLKCFREHPNNARQSFEPYIEFVKDCEREIRECYQETIDLPSNEFIQMIVLDAAFLIYYFLYESVDRGPFRSTEFPIVQNNALGIMENKLGRDIMLEENQLPFFVLNEIYHIAFGEVSSRFSFIDLALQFIGSVVAPGYAGFPGQVAMKSIISDGKMAGYAYSIVHLVDLMRRCCCLSFDSKPKARQENAPIPKFYNAKQLSDSGIKFKSGESDNPLEIKFDKRNGVLTVPKLAVYCFTDAILRSILLFEQCHYQNRHFSGYIFFMDGLIDTENDIRILAQNEILNNFFGSEERSADLFNKLTDNMSLDFSRFIYSDEIKGLEDYITQPCNKWKAILWSKYFNHPWAIISVVAAVILFVLTLLQAITGFLQLK